MTLENLKKDWNEKTQHAKYSKAELESIFEMRTKRSMKKLNTNMLMDAIFMMLTTVAFIAISYALGLENLLWISCGMVSIACTLLIHYKIKYRSLNHLNFEDQGIRSALSKSLNRLTMYIKLYKVAVPTISTILYLSYLIQLNYYKHQSLFSKELLTWKLAVAPVVFFASYLLVITLIRLMYKKTLEDIKLHLSQLKQAEH
ncbi:hypothetical protein [Fulvivirga ligni]|uniref:hypothetical protein n=1 Tax=Fulvivirga ligni TaxID=2904246 RepID=UPI001F32C36F|nr:hypothetical protein [Fulvivirga ligni]UII20058.1 hypothetical protein LVD16_19625 [Fulvivirga ligni]